MTAGGRSRSGKPMAAAPGLPGSLTARTGRSTPLILRTDERRISAAPALDVSRPFGDLYPGRGTAVVDENERAPARAELDRAPA